MSSVFPPRAVRCGFLDFVVDPFKPVEKNSREGSKDGVTSGAPAKDVKKKRTSKKHVVELTSPQLQLLQRVLQNAPRGVVLSQDEAQVLRRLRVKLAEV